MGLDLTPFLPEGYIASDTQARNFERAKRELELDEFKAEIIKLFRKKKMNFDKHIFFEKKNKNTNCDFEVNHNLTLYGTELENIFRYFQEQNLIFLSKKKIFQEREKRITFFN